MQFLPAVIKMEYHLKVWQRPEINTNNNNEKQLTISNNRCRRTKLYSSVAICKHGYNCMFLYAQQTNTEFDHVIWCYDIVCSVHLNNVYHIEIDKKNSIADVWKRNVMRSALD